MVIKSSLVLFFALLPLSLSAESDVVQSKRLSLNLAIDIAKAAVDQCRKDGYQVTAVIVDRGGNEQVTLRDDFASRFTIQIAEEKANLVILSGTESGGFRESRSDIRPELNHIKGLVVMQGGVPIRSEGTLLGAIGVSGAPGGEKDEACAKAAIEKYNERLEFAD